MSNIILSAENLSKSYLVGHNSAQTEGYTALRDVIARNASNLARKTVDMLKGRAIVEGDAVEEFWALKDVSFEIKLGERIGIIGRNGAGKSTLLKILSRVTEPTSGRIKIAGRVASLLEVGTGFHPELTGRENIFLNGAILGMTSREIQRKFDEIVDFAEVKNFLDTPVKRYSSGMYVRLAFAIAAHLEPEILIVDEVLSVGDAQFQKKSLGKMEEAGKDGRTIIFVSHQLGLIKSICSKCILLNKGEIISFDKTDEIINLYQKQTIEQNIISTNNLTIKKILLEPKMIESNQVVRYSIQIHSNKDDLINSLGILIYNQLEQRIAIIDLRSEKQNYNIKENQILTIEGVIKQLPLVEGCYKIGVFIGGNYVSENIFDLLLIDVFNHHNTIIPYPADVRGYVNLNHSFEYEIN
jgi:lipopolysaccharide transport system ATP-binding protein